MGTVTLGGKFQEFDVVILENEFLRVAVLPQIGAKINEFFDKRIKKDLLFHHPRVEVRHPTFGLNVDNWWSGGIDDAFPTGHPCLVEGEELPFLGEVWSLPWQVTQSSPHSITLTRFGIITPFKLERTMRLLPDSQYLELEYSITNVGYVAFDYLWGFHPALPIGENTKISVPAKFAWHGDGTKQNDFSEDFYSGGKPQNWPIRSISQPPGKTAITWNHLYLSDLSDGWLAVSDEKSDWGFGVQFEQELFSHVHIWIVDGGWRGIRTAVVEPWTGRPARLDQAIEQGFSRKLEPGHNVQTAIKLIAFKPHGEIQGFDEKGNQK